MDNREKRQHGSNKDGDQRNPFQIDRDRIIYSSAFRRLAQVTQVVSANEGHVFHNRLTHSLKVAQVARRLAEKLINEQNDLANRLGGIDPDVVEAAALAHDLGHPPFGHIAEKELDKCAIDAGLSDGFEGNAQSFRILTRLAVNRTEYCGLDLTRATLRATFKYPWLRDISDKAKNNKDKKWKKFSAYLLDEQSFKFALNDDISDEKQAIEASIMEFADDVTYSVHDLEDFYLAGLIPIGLLSTQDSDEFLNFKEKWIQNKPEQEKQQIEKNQEKLQNLLVSTYNLIGEYQPGSSQQLAQIKYISSTLIQRYIKSVELIEDYGDCGYLKKDKDVELELDFFQRLVWHYVIYNPRLTTQQYGQRKIIKTLFEFYQEAIGNNDINLVPARFQENLERLRELDSKNLEKIRMAVDIVSALSEAEAVFMFRRITGVEQSSFMNYFI